jgi:hypothetical protein
VKTNSLDFYVERLLVFSDLLFAEKKRRYILQRLRKINVRRRRSLIGVTNFSWSYNNLVR